MRTPDVVIVGAQKAATTGVLRTLAQHPDVVTPRVQEAVNLHDGVAAWGPWVNKYEPHLLHVGSGFLVVKLATAMHFRGTLTTIRDLNPAAVVIAVLRHPIERMFSLHRYAVQHGLESRPLEHALRDDRVQRADHWRLKTYSGGSRYAEAIAGLQDVFEPHRAVYLDYGEVPTGTWFPRVSGLLGLSGPPIPMVAANESRPPRSALLARAMNVGTARSLARATVPAPWREPLRGLMQRWNSKDAAPDAAGLPADLRAALVDRHLPDVDAAETVLGKHLPHWRR